MSKYIKSLKLKSMKIEAGKPHPKHPDLIVTKITKNNNMKIKNLKGERHPKYPFLIRLSKKKEKALIDSIKHWKRPKFT